MGNSMFAPADRVEGIDGVLPAHVESVEDTVGMMWPRHQTEVPSHEAAARAERAKVVPIPVPTETVQLPYCVNSSGFELTIDDDGTINLLTDITEVTIPMTLELFPGAVLAYDGKRGFTTPTPRFLNPKFATSYKYNAVDKCHPMPILTKFPARLVEETLSFHVGDDDDGKGLWIKIYPNDTESAAPIYWAVLNFSPSSSLPRLDEDDRKVQVRIRQAYVQQGDRVYKIHTIYGATGEDDACCVCLTEKRDVMVYPCSHICLCEGCARQTVVELGTCPVCREEVSGLMLLETNK